ARHHNAPALFPYATLFRSKVSSVKTDLTTPLVGHFNIYNALAAAGASRTLGIGGGEAMRELTWVTPPHGRFERVDAGQKYMALRSEEHTSELQSRENLVCR